MWTLKAGLCCLVLFGSLFKLAVSQDPCSPSCVIYGSPEGYVAAWTPIDANSTLTGVTLVDIVNTDLGTTRTSTKYDDQMSELNFPTNADGTRIQKIVYSKGTKTFTTEIAFPTSFNVIPQTFIWYGTLSTLNDYGESTCVTARSATISVEYFTQPATITMPDHWRLDNDDRGWLWAPFTITAVVSEWPDIISVSPSQAAFASCDEVTHDLPIGPPYDVAYAYTTSVSFEGGTSTSQSRSVSDESSTPADNIDADPTSEDTSLSTRTVVSEGPEGPTTTVEAVDSTASGASGSVFKLGTVSKWHFVVNIVVVTMSCCNLV